MAEQINFWGMHFADWVSLAPAGLAVTAGIAAWRAQTGRVMTRRRQKAMRSLGLSKSDIRTRVKTIMGGEPRTAADELDWLARIYAGHPPNRRHGPRSPVPITYSLRKAELVGLSKAYAAYAASLRSGTFLGAASVPVAEHDAAMASEVSGILTTAASGGGSEISCGCRRVAVDSSRLQRKLEIWQLPDVSNGMLAYDLFVSYRRHRLAPLVSLGDQSASPEVTMEVMETSDQECESLKRKLASPRLFDAVLPRLSDWRVERDDANGRLRLHLALAETTYAAVLTDHYPATFDEVTLQVGSAEERQVKGEQAKLLTLSTIVITSDRMMLFAKRSAVSGSHPNQFGPAVNGNLELRARHGIHPDSGTSGIPDPRRALAREAKEELGLHLPPEQIQVVGLGKFSDPKEHGTHVLLTAAYVNLSSEEIAQGMCNADPLEGEWEFGGEIIAAPIPRKPSQAEALLSWLLNSDELTPHAVMTGIAVTAKYFPVTEEQLRRLSSSPAPVAYEISRLPS